MSGAGRGSPLRRVSELRRTVQGEGTTPPTRQPWTLFMFAPGRESPYRLRLTRVVGIGLILGLALLIVGGLTLWQRNQQLEAELAGLRQTQALATTREDELHNVLGLQKGKLTDQNTQLQAQTQQIQSIAGDLDDLKARMATLDRHNAQLREVLGLDAPSSAGPDQGGEAPAATDTPSPTPSPVSNSLRPGGFPGLAAPPADDAPPAASPVAEVRDGDAITRLLAGFRGDILLLRSEIDDRTQTMSTLDDRTAQQLAEWATTADEQAAGPDSPDVAAALAQVANEVDNPPAAPPPAPPAAPPKKVVKAPSSIPAGLPYYGYISSPFGWRDSPFIPGKRTYHKGMDIVASTGTPVHATQAGTIIVAGWTDVYGNTVMIDHGHGWVTIYGHNSRIKVKVGQWVDQGQLIALSGNTGPSTGPHIHYEIRHTGTPVNPANYR